VFFEYLPKHSISPRGAKIVWVRHAGKDKERTTVMLLGDSEGAKVKPFVVLKTTRSKVAGGDQANWTERRGFGIHVWKDAKAFMATAKEAPRPPAEGSNTGLQTLQKDVCDRVEHSAPRRHEAQVRQ